MRSITEDMEATNEELQSANEELQSSNEEMQSLNEDLETSKEELQSTNEELTIVNQELLDKQEQLNELHSKQVEAGKRLEASEKAQKKLASHLKLATDSAKVGIWSLDIKTSKLEWNGLLKKMWGFDEHLDNITYEDWQKNIVEEDKQLTFQKIEDSKVNHSIYDAEYRIIRANDGAILWMKSTGQYQHDEFGEAITLTGINLDITEQVKAKKLLEESEARSRAFVESNVVAVCFTHLENATIFEANNAFLNMIGYTQQDLKKGKINWLQYTPAENHKFEYEAIEKAKSLKVSPPYEKEIIRTDGKRITVIKAKAIINKDEIMSVFVDITEQKEAAQQLKAIAIELAAKNKIIEVSEKRLSNILSQSLMAIGIYTGPEMVISFANKQMLNALGRGDVVLNKPLLEGLPELKDQIIPKLLADVYNTGVAYEGIEIKAILMRKGTPTDTYFKFYIPSLQRCG
jgi:two-component system CheB/CheR fusion protein